MPESVIINFDLEGVTCVNCTTTIENAVRKTCCDNNISYRSIKANYTKKQLRITLDKPPQNKQDFIKLIEKDIEECGFSASQADNHKLKAAIGLLGGLFFIILSFLSITLSLPLLIICCAVSSLLTIYLGYRFYKNAFVELFKTQTLSMDSLFALSTATSIVVMIIALFVPWLPMMFETGILIFGFRHLGIVIKSNLEQQVTGDFSHRELADKQITVIKDLKNSLKNVENLEIGDEIVIEPERVIPVNCRYMGKNSIEVDTSIIDGDAAFPSTIRPGEFLQAGMRIARREESISAIVTDTFEDSYLASSDRELDQSEKSATPLQDFSQTIMKYLLPTTLMLALIAGIIISILFSPALGIQCAISILVSVCPCTFGLNAPLALQTGVKKGVQHDVLFKTTKGIEIAPQITDAVLDASGTISTSNSQVVDHKILDETLSPQQFWHAIASLEQYSSHSHAKAIMRHVQQQKTDGDLTAEITSKDGQPGVQGTVNNDTWAIGNSTFLMDDLKIDIPQDYLAKNIIFVARNRKLVGLLVLADPIRAEVKDIVAALEQQKINIHICTGNNGLAAEFYARELGVPLSQVRANCRLKDPDPDKNKSKYIEKLQLNNKIVAMIGDGPNDDDALKQANLSIIIQSPVARAVNFNQADIVIQQNSLKPLMAAFTIAKQTTANIKQNIIISLSYNIVTVILMMVVLLTLSICLPPSLGVTLMILQSCLVLLNVNRLKNQKVYSEQRSTAESIGSYKKIIPEISNAPAKPGKQFNETDRATDNLPRREDPEFAKKLETSFNFTSQKSCYLGSPLPANLISSENSFVAY